MIFIKNINNCKVLSPVGSPDILDACIYSGADYVYLAANKYNARGFASNFTYDEIEDAIDFCHKYNVKLFVTVNIAILENEIVDVIDYVYYLYSHGVDGVIVSDIGLGDLINKIMPNFSLHASTQMTIYDYSFIKWLADNGYNNVNISREVPISRIRQITDKKSQENLDVNIEAFAHGAICYCYSGRCLMSSVMGGRSGNRGLCAQPCRMRYEMLNQDEIKIADKNYLLSTKDLCTYKDVKDLIDSGINTIKIEGRMKSREYVSAITYAYHQAVHGHFNDDDFLLLNLAFNRGLTSGYIMENPSTDVVSRIRSGSQGYAIGRVSKVEGRKITIKFLNKRYPTRIINGDGLKFEYENHTTGTYVSKIINQNRNKITIQLNEKKKIYEDSLVFITYSKYLEDMTKKIINEKHTNKIPLNLKLIISDDMNLKIICTYDNNKTYTYTPKAHFQEALNKPITREIINKQLRKTGNTDFKIESIEYENFKDNLFMPIGELNSIRRNLLKNLDEIILKSDMPTDEQLQDAKVKLEKFKQQHYIKNNKIQDYNLEFIAHVDTIKKVEIASNYDYIKDIYYDINMMNKTHDEYFNVIYDELKNVKEIIKDKNLIWVLPPLLLDQDIITVQKIIDKLQNEKIITAVRCDNIGVASQLTNCPIYGYDLNIYNNYTIEKLINTPKFERLGISHELSYDDIKTLNEYEKCPLEFMVFGNLDLMITEDNFENIIDGNEDNYYYLQDKRNQKFKVKQDIYNHSHIYDYQTLNLISEIDKIRKTAIKYLEIDLMNHDNVKEILDYIQDSLHYLKAKKPVDKTYQGNFKKGLYKKMN